GLAEMTARSTSAESMRDGCGFAVVPDRSAEALAGFVKENVIHGAVVRTDGWASYPELSEAGYSHDVLTLGGDPDKAEAHLPMIHLVFSNLKTWFKGTHHGRVEPKHL